MWKNDGENHSKCQESILKISSVETFVLGEGLNLGELGVLTLGTDHYQIDGVQGAKKTKRMRARQKRKCRWREKVWNGNVECMRDVCKSCECDGWNNLSPDENHCSCVCLILYWGRALI